MKNIEKTNLKFLKITSLVLVVLYCSYYYFTRAYISNIKDYLMVEMNLNAGDFSKISAAFSISYSLCQILGGYLMDKINLRYLIPGMLFLGCVANFIFINSNTITIATYSRYLLGFCFCIGGIGGTKYLSIVWPKNFSFLSNFASIVMAFAAALASHPFVKSLMDTYGWKTFIKYYIVFGIVLGILLLYVLKVIKLTEASEDKTSTEEKSHPFLTSLKYIVTKPGFLFIGVYTFSIIAACYVLMDGAGNSFFKAKFPDLDSSYSSLPATYNMYGCAIGFIYNIFAEKLKMKLQMIIHALICIISTIILIYGNPCFYTFIGCCFFLGFCSSGQILGFIWLQKNLESQYRGLSFGLLNYIGMFVGCGLVQRFSGIILEWNKNFNITKLGMSPYEGYTYMDNLNMFKFLLIPGVLALTAALIIKTKE